MKHQKTPKQLVIVTTGGSGGHIFPAQAIAAALEEQSFEVAFVTDKRGQAFQGARHIRTYRLMAEHVMGRSPLRKLAAVFKLYCGAVQALFLLRRLKPAAVVGVGGYASVPAALAAELMRIPVMLHEQNAVLGRANRLLAAGATLIATSFAPTARLPAATPALCVGMPARPGIMARADAPYPPADREIRLLIFAGSQGARFFSTRLPEALLRLPADLRGRIRLTQQVRAEDKEAVEARYQTAGFKRVVLKSFFDDMPELLERSHLVIARAGASTLTELMIIGRPAILIPLPGAADGHQLENAKIFRDAGAGWLAAEADFDPQAVAERIQSLLTQPEQLAQAGRQAHLLAKPQAAETLAQAVADIIKGRKK